MKFHVQVNELFADVDTLIKKKFAENTLFKCQQSYIKVIKTHFCVIDHHNLVKKLIFMMKVDLLQLKKLCH